MKRRQGVLAAAAVAAVAAGAGWRWWREAGDGGAAAPRAVATEPDASGEAVPAGFWELRFPRPEGGELALASLRGSTLLLNFWATWCAPCIEEMPELDRFAKAQAGWRVVGLAIDGPTPVREFLKRTPVGFAIGLAGFEGTELARSLGNGGGALPFTAVIDANGRIRRRKLGKTTSQELEAWAKAL